MPPIPAQHRTPAPCRHSRLTAIAWLLVFGCAPLRMAAAETPVISNDAEPSGGVRTVELEELWRVGGEDEEDILLGVIGQALADDAGRTYLLDIQLMEVQVIDADGGHLSTLGHQGDGPGEIQRALDMMFLPDGTLGLVQAFPGKIVKVTLDGLPAGDLRPGGDDPSAGGFFALRGCQAEGAVVVLSGTRMSRDGSSMTARHFVALFDDEGVEQTTLLTQTFTRERGFAERNEKQEFFPHAGGWVLAPDGQVVVAPERNAYRMQFYTAAGKVTRIVERPYTSWERTSRELENARSALMMMRRRNRGDVNIVVEPTERDIVSMTYAGDGRLWVLSSRGMREESEGIHSLWDVFDAGGEFVEQIAIACEGTATEDRLMFAGHDRAILVKAHADAVRALRGQGEDEDEDEVNALEVICYRIPNG